MDFEKGQIWKGSNNWIGLCAGLNFYPVYHQPSFKGVLVIGSGSAAKNFVSVAGKAKIDIKNLRI